MRHINYLKYLVCHKWFVFVAGTKIRGCSWYRLAIHDLSKFLPCEWYPYAYCFYAEDGSKRYIETADFNYAWNHHQHCNKHHWQHWMLKEDSGKIQLLDMPEKYIKEMVADWAGAGKAITGKWEVAEWYLKNATKILISRDTRREVENILSDTFGLSIKTTATIQEL